LKWTRSTVLQDYIASARVSSFEVFASSVESLFKEDRIPSSGIIISRNGQIADGDDVEKSCYARGGFKFLFKSYADDGVDESTFPLLPLKSLLERIGRLYLSDVIGSGSQAVSLDVCWAVCQRDGDYGTLHNHIPPDHDGSARYSGMFYLHTPPSINPKTFPNGCLHIITPSEIVYFPPIPGTVVLWPSHLIHGIHPFRGLGDRLGIAFDLTAR
jgi:hypothetical protein